MEVLKFQSASEGILAFTNLEVVEMTTAEYIKAKSSTPGFVAELNANNVNRLLNVSFDNESKAVLQLLQEGFTSSDVTLKELQSQVSNWVANHRNPGTRDIREDAYWTINDLYKIITREGFNPVSSDLNAYHSIFRRFKNQY